MIFSAVYCLPLDVHADPSLQTPNQTELPEPRWHLFLDDHEITRSTGFRRVLHHPKPRGVVLEAEKPWETFGVTPWYVGRHKGGGYECYYQTLWHERGMRVVNRMAYAISDDALVW